MFNKAVNISIISLLILLFAVFSCNKGFRVIINPETDSNNTSGSLIFFSVKLINTAIVMHFDSYVRQGSWFQISSETTLIGNSEKVYKIISCEGITLDEKKYTPESGHTPFTIFFEPLAEGTSRRATMTGITVSKGLSSTK